MRGINNKQFELVNGALNEGSTSYHLHLLRGLAAVLVLINHYRNFFFVEYSELENANLFTTLVYSIAGLGHQAVMIFFVLSGFFITKSILTKVSSNAWSWKNYLVSRLVRLYTVLLPVLLLAFIIDSTGSRLFDYSFKVADIDANLSPLVLLGNLVFLQDIFVPEFGTNAPLWSLAYEFWYYMLFPCLLLIFISRKSPLKSLMYLIISIAIILLVGKEILLYFVIWLLGSLLYVLPIIKIKSNAVKLFLNAAAAFALIGALGMSRLGVIHSPYVGDLLVGLTFAMLVYAILHFKFDFNHLLSLKTHYHRTSEQLADFSYTLYLSHFPLLVFIAAYIRNMGGGTVQPTIINIIYGLGVCALIMIFAYLLSLITEARTNKVRDFVFRVLTKKENKMRNSENVQYK